MAKSSRSQGTPTVASLENVEIPPVVGIGASAGGLEAFTEFVRAIPADTHAAFVLVQHLDPKHRSLLSELLARSAAMPVTEITDGLRILPRQFYVIPPNRELSIKGGVLHLTPRPKKIGVAVAVDQFLCSLAEDQGKNSVGVILSGAGSDGAKGLLALKRAGGVTFAQEPISAKYDSMPRNAIANGAAEYVLTPAEIAGEIARISKGLPVSRATSASPKNPIAQSRRLLSDDPNLPAAEWADGKGREMMRRIMFLLRDHAGLDFSLYRSATIDRRIARRMGFRHIDSLEKYGALLAEDASEIEALHQDLLIGVTSFFRNPSVFEAVKQTVFDRLLKTHSDKESFRFWVVGCSTGQEAYSLAMVFHEFCDERKIRPRLQVFASDVNARAIAVGRLGHYAKNQLQGVSAARLAKFFTPDGDGYRVDKALRDQMVFSQHNLLTDPPFTRIDLISCRNMLIYIDSKLQQRIFPSFHYALRTNGCLLLGSSESVGAAANLFDATEERKKIYFKKPGVSLPRMAALQIPTRKEPQSRAVLADRVASLQDYINEADRLVKTKYTLPGVIVNDRGEILQFRGAVQPYLEVPSGRPSLYVFSMAREGLGVAIQRSLRKAAKQQVEVRDEVRLEAEIVSIIVAPLARGDAQCYLILFQKTARVISAAGADPKGKGTAHKKELQAIRSDYAEMQDSINVLREQHDTAVEELQASNEEVQSSNEELQSLNEELETSNEELESTNEELTTLNEELGVRNSELRDSEQRLREQAKLVDLAPIIVRGANDKIISWNAGAVKLYGYSAEEAIGQFSRHLLGTKFAEPLDQITRDFSGKGSWEGEVIQRRKDGTDIIVATQWVASVSPGNDKAGVVLEVNSDISARRRAEESLRKAQALNQRVLQTTEDTVAVIDLAGRFTFLNDGGVKALRLEKGSAAGHGWSACWTPGTREVAEEALRKAVLGETTRCQALTAAGNEAGRWFDIVVQPINGPDGKAEAILAVCRDVTERKATEAAAIRDARLASLRAEVAVELSRGGDLAAILAQLSQVIIQHADAVSVRIWLAEGNPVRLRLFTSEGLYAMLNSHQQELAIGESRVGQTAATKRPHITQHVEADVEICDPVWARRERVTSFAAYPLLSESSLIGVIAVMGRYRMEPAVLKELALCADAIAALIQRKTAEEDRAQLLEQMTEARNAAVAASRAKDDFIATLSHELRTPLNPALMLASGHADDESVPEELRVVFRTIRDNVLLEARLIDDLLDITRIARGKLSLEAKPLNLNEVAANAAAIVATNLDIAQVEIKARLTAPDATVVGDAVRLQQVVWNLLNNAVKFTPRPGGRISLETNNLIDGFVTLRVSDNGIGIPASGIQRIFHAFAQLENGRGGLGLGLAISRQLVEQHGGSIHAGSAGEGRGSTFEINLPLARAGAELAEAPAPSPARPEIPLRSEVRLLLIEDHKSTRDTLSALMRKRGLEVATAGSVEEARAIVGEKKFELVISDLGLPDGDGYTLLGEIRAQQPWVAAIALSGYGADQDRDRSAKAGFGAHLTKPVSMPALDQAIVAALKDTKRPPLATGG